MNPVTLIPPDPSLMVVALTALKAYLRIDGDYEDSLVSDQYAEAAEFIERETQQQMLTCTKRLYLDRFPTGASMYGLGLGPDGAEIPVPLATATGLVISQRAARTIDLPSPPLQSVSAVNYLTGGNATVLDASVYTVDNATMPGRIVLNGGQSWPATDDVANAVWIDFVCGYGGVNDVPKAFGQMIKWTAAHRYENRQAATELTLAELPFGLRALIESHMFREAVSA